MVIERRNNAHREFVDKVHEVKDDPASGRSAVLQGIRLDIYRFIQDNPGCTRDDVSKGTHIKSSTCTARIRELIEEGYVYEPQGIRKMNSSGVRARVLMITDRVQSGKKLDKVKIKVFLIVNKDGTLYSYSEVQSGNTSGERGIKGNIIGEKTITMSVPHYASDFKQENGNKVNRLSTTDILLHADAIIDADYEVVESS